MIAELRALPSVTAILAWPAVAAAVARFGHHPVVRAIREALAEARVALKEGRELEPLEAAIVRRASESARGSLRPVLNATGVLVHTNLGRSPLAREALEAIGAVAEGYSTLEYDLASGERGERQRHTEADLCALTSAEDAIVVNNNAAAALLALSALATGREVIVSRGELIEIGGGFRVPDLLAQSGATLIEVGTTNRTHGADYARAITERTALVLKVHRSNFEMTGFTCEVSPAELATLAHGRGVPVVYDVGGGSLARAAWGPGEPCIPEAIASGIDAVMFSGDKLLGGPQAGIIAGRRALLAPMRRHPLMRAVRPDKLCIAALGATLTLWRDAPERVPIVRMLEATCAKLEVRAVGLLARLDALDAGASVIATDAVVGGGAAPSRTLPSIGLRLEVRDAPTLAARLRAGSPAVVARIEAGAVILDLRTIPAAEDEALLGALRRALSSADG